MKKRLLAILLALIMMVGLLPTAVFAADSDFVIEYGVLKKYTGPGGDVVIPDGVTSIRWGVFQNCTNLTSVVIPDGMTSIERSTFSGCTSLTTIVIPGSVTKIEDSAFYNCESLTTIAIPGSVTKIGYSAFKGCEALTSITIPGSVKTIGDRAFENCFSLTSAKLQEGVSRIGNYAFSDCDMLTSITIPGSVTKIGDSILLGCSSMKDVYYGGASEKELRDTIDHWAGLGVSNVTIHCLGAEPPALVDDVFVVEDGVLLAYRGGGGDITIPAGVTSIGEKAFFVTTVTNVTVPDGVTSIGEDAFRGCGVETITIADTVTTIEQFAFSECRSLTSVILPPGLETISMGTFENCENLTSIFIPDSVTHIGPHAFNGCHKLTDVYYGGTLEQWERMDINLTNTIYGYLAQDKIHYSSGVEDVGTPKEPPAEPIPASGTAYPSTQEVDVDGEKITFQCYALKDENGYDTNYIKLRDLADILNSSAAQFEVDWNDGQVTITTGHGYTRNGSEQKTPFSGQRAYKTATAQTLVDGKAVDLAAFTLNDDNGGGYTYYKLRDLGEALGIKVDWTAERGIFIETK